MTIFNCVFAVSARHTPRRLIEGGFRVVVALPVFIIIRVSVETLFVSTPLILLPVVSALLVLTATLSILVQVVPNRVMRIIVRPMESHCSAIRLLAGFWVAVRCLRGVLAALEVSGFVVICGCRDVDIRDIDAISILLLGEETALVIFTDILLLISCVVRLVELVSLLLKSRLIASDICVLVLVSPCGNHLFAATLGTLSQIAFGCHFYFFYLRLNSTVVSFSSLFSHG